MRDLFMMVMEAEGDLLQPFDSGEIADTNQQPVEDVTTSQPSGNEGFDEPPPLTDDEDFQYSDDSGNTENVADTNDQTDDDPENKENGDKLSEKANNILNQKLYDNMVNRNNEIDEIINNIQRIVPLLPFEVVKSNDEYLNKLKSALSKGRQYVINKFIDAQYGENLLFFEKLDALYTLLLNSIDTNLKKIKEES